MFVDTNRQFKLTSRIWSRSEAPNVEFAPSVFLPELPHVKTHFILMYKTNFKFVVAQVSSSRESLMINLDYKLQIRRLGRMNFQCKFVFKFESSLLFEVARLNKTMHFAQK